MPHDLATSSRFSGFIITIDWQGFGLIKGSPIDCYSITIHICAGIAGFPVLSGSLNLSQHTLFAAGDFKLISKAAL